MKFMINWGCVLLIAMVGLICVQACATAQTVATEALVASDAAADEFADNWLEGTTHRVYVCRRHEPPLETEAARAECLGVFAEGDKAKAALKVLIAVQQSVVVAVTCSQKSIESPADVKLKCIGHDKANWLKLAADLKSAWDALLPYINASNEELKQ